MHKDNGGRVETKRETARRQRVESWRMLGIPAGNTRNLTYGIQRRKLKRTVFDDCILGDTVVGDGDAAIAGRGLAVLVTSIGLELGRVEGDNLGKVEFKTTRPGDARRRPTNSQGCIQSPQAPLSERGQRYVPRPRTVGPTHGLGVTASRRRFSPRYTGQNKRPERAYRRTKWPCRGTVLDAFRWPR